jgi:shikimate dehydrogenase
LVRHCAVLGAPIIHSLSPVLHTAAYAHLGLDAWEYGRYDVDETRLGPFLEGLDSTWRGLSLTMPLKQVALTCVDEVSELAHLVTAANTIVLDDGRRFADNTDVPGVVNALSERGADSGGEAAILGGGATARSAVAALSGRSDRITIYLRTPTRAEALHDVADAVGVELDVLPWDKRWDAVAAPLLINTTPAGVADDLAGAVPSQPGFLLDVIYAPWPTALARAWGDAGGTVIAGLDLLAHQARLQVTLFTGYDVPVGVLRDAGMWAIESRAGSPPG